MRKNKIYYHIYSGTKDPCCITDKSYPKAKITWICPGCNYPKQDILAVDIELENERIDNCPLNFVQGCGLPIVNTKFLFSLGKDAIEQNFYLGKVFMANGLLLDDWVTFRGKRKILIRGSKNVSSRQCEQCGRNVYYAAGTRYIYPEPDSDSILFESDLSGLVLPENLFDKIDLSLWEKLIIDKLPVLASPKDGLTNLNSFYRRSSQVG